MKLLICGKGGCGKSTVTALLAQAMQKSGKNVLIVDADESNIGLYRLLGLDLPQSLMDSFGGKKGFRQKTSGTGMSLGGPPQLFPQDMTINSLPDGCVSRTDNLAVMSIGKIHHFGEGCACPMGNLFQKFFSSLTLSDNDLVIVDTAAGVEYFGRRLDAQCDRILVVVDPSYESIMMARRVKGLAKEINLPVQAILNKLTPDIENRMADSLEGISIIGRVPDHSSIFSSNLGGDALDISLPEINALCHTLKAVL